MQDISTDVNKPVRRLFTEVQGKGDGYRDKSHGSKGLKKKGRGAGHSEEMQ